MTAEFNWDDARIFLAIARVGTLSGAADKMNMGIATVSRLLDRLEQALNVPLFSRHQSGYRLTDDGEALLARAEALEYAGLAFGEAAQLQGHVAGVVRLATSDNLATHFILPSLKGLLDHYPELRVEVLSGVQPVNLHRRDAGFAVVVAIMLAIDLLLQGRRGSHSMTMKQAAGWSILWVTLSLLFNAAFWWYLVQTQGRAVADPQALAFLTGYLIEKALAVDNVFVWLMLFSYFAVPPALQRRVLVYGVLGAIVLRTIMIFAGSWLISQFDWLLYVFGAFLLFTGVKMALAKEDDSGIGDKPLVRWIRSHLRMTDKIESERFFTRKNGVLFATPLLLVLILVELSDVIFAVDSIPAIFAVTTDPFIVLTSNLFAILGLRAMYFLLAGVAERFSMLKYGLSVILVFIGVKMLIVDFYHIPVAISLGVVGGILTVTLLINAWVNKQHDKQRKLPE